MASRRAWPRLVALVASALGTGIGVVGLVGRDAAQVGAVARSAAMVRPAPVPALVARDASAVAATVATIREAATAAQLEVRVSIPLVRERGLPVTARRLETCEARLSEIIRAVSALQEEGGRP